MPSKRPNGYLARWRDESGREHSRLFRTVDGAPKRKATDWEREQSAKVRAGTHVDPRAGKVKVKDAAQTWRAAQAHHRPQTARQVEATFRLHLIPHLGDRTIISVTKADLQALVKRWIDEGAKPGTIRVRFAFIGALFRAAAEEGTIPRSPAARVKLPELVPAPVEPLSVEQVRRLLAALPDEIRPVAVVGAGCGTRVSEALGLTLDRVRFLRRDVVIDRQPDPRPPYTALVPLKNSRRTPSRVVPLPSFVAEALSAVTAGKDGRLFVKADGTPMPAWAVQAAMRDAVKETGLPSGTTFHDLRHFYASTLIEAGESVSVVAARLGDRPAEVLETYSHLWPDSSERTRKIMDEAFQDHVDQVRTADAP